jgi:hypothetical protein
MCDVFPEGKGRNASLIVTLCHLPTFSSDACFSSKPSLRYTSSRTLKITQPSGSTTRTSSSSASGGARFVVKTPTQTAAEKGGRAGSHRRVRGRGAEGGSTATAWRQSCSCAGERLNPGPKALEGRAHLGL